MAQQALDHILFDVDGVMYEKEREYSEGNGSVQTAHDFFRYKGHILLKKGADPVAATELLLEEYFRATGENNLKEVVFRIAPKEKEEYKRLLEMYKNVNGDVFGKGYGLNAKGCPNFLHNLIAHIDFTSILPKNQEFVSIIDCLKQNYGLGIITSEVFETIESVARAIGFSLEDFYFKDQKHELLFSKEKGRHYPILCRYNCTSKPEPDGFDKALRILQADPNRVVYIGDRYKNDIEPAIKAGMNAIHLVHSEPGIVKKNGYWQSGSLNDLKEVIECFKR